MGLESCFPRQKNKTDVSGRVSGHGPRIGPDLEQKTTHEHRHKVVERAICGPRVASTSKCKRVLPVKGLGKDLHMPRRRKTRCLSKTYGHEAKLLRRLQDKMPFETYGNEAKLLRKTKCKKNINLSREWKCVESMAMGPDS
jgi:hypothetical protein